MLGIREREDPNCWKSFEQITCGTLEIPPGNCGILEQLNLIEDDMCIMENLKRNMKMKGNFYLSYNNIRTSEYMKRMWENMEEKYLIYKFGRQNRNGEMSWKILYSKILEEKLLIQGKGKGEGEGEGRGNIILQIDRSKTYLILTQQSTKFFIIFTLSIATLL